MKRIGKSLIHIIVIVAVIVVFYMMYSKYLDKKINELYLLNKQSVNHANGLSEKDKGNVLINHSLAGGNLLVMGSSELSSPVSENPKNLFPNNLYEGDATFVGHAYVQNALHAMNLGANFRYLDENDIVIVNSLQWFTDSDIVLDGFFSNFSELQFYEFLHNNMISDKNKKYLCKRYIHLENLKESKLYPLLNEYIENILGKSILGTIEATGYQMVSGELTYDQTYILARLYTSDSIIGKMLYQVFQPYYWFRYQFLVLKDKYKSYKWLKEMDSVQSGESIKSLDWKEIYEDAEKEGKAACTNNDLYVYDEYYIDYIKENYEDIRGRNSETELLISNEWNDYKFFLDICNDLELHPYIVIMSTNGLYYDYLGMDKEKRNAFYEKAEQIAKDYGMECLNLKDYEYQPYFYCDVMHLGWKGWTYVVQNIIEHYEE